MGEGALLTICQMLWLFFLPLPSNVFQGHYPPFLLYVRCVYISVSRRKSTLLGQTHTGHTLTWMLKTRRSTNSLQVKGSVFLPVCGTVHSSFEELFSLSFKRLRALNILCREYMDSFKGSISLLIFKRSEIKCMCTAFIKFSKESVIQK